MGSDPINLPDLTSCFSLPCPGGSGTLLFFPTMAPSLPGRDICTGRSPLPPNLSRTGFLSLRHQLKRLLLRRAFPELPAVNSQPPSLSCLPAQPPQDIAVSLLIYSYLSSPHLGYNSVKAEILSLMFAVLSLVHHIVPGIEWSLVNIDWWNNWVISFILHKNTIIQVKQQVYNHQWHTQGHMSSKWHLTSESTTLPCNGWLCEPEFSPRFSAFHCHPHFKIRRLGDLPCLLTIF